MAMGQPAVWKVLRAQGIFRGSGPAHKVAFLYTGQGSQYLNMLRVFHRAEPILADTFAEADRIMKPFLSGRSLTEFMFVEGDDPEVTARAERDLAQIAIMQPAVIASEIGTACFHFPPAHLPSGACTDSDSCGGGPRTITLRSGGLAVATAIGELTKPPRRAALLGFTPRLKCEQF
jgi:hypothetical protein